MMTLGMLEDKQGEQRKSPEQVSEGGLRRKMKTFVSNFVEHLMIDVGLGGRARATKVMLTSAISLGFTTPSIRSEFFYQV
jgi:hypothetical protein